MSSSNSPPSPPSLTPSPLNSAGGQGQEPQVAAIEPGRRVGGRRGGLLCAHCQGLQAGRRRGRVERPGSWRARLETAMKAGQLPSGTGSGGLGVGASRRALAAAGAWAGAGAPGRGGENGAAPRKAARPSARGAAARTRSGQRGLTRRWQETALPAHQPEKRSASCACPTTHSLPLCGSTTDTPLRPRTQAPPLSIMSSKGEELAGHAPAGTRARRHPRHSPCAPQACCSRSPLTVAPPPPLPCRPLPPAAKVGGMRVNQTGVKHKEHA